MNVNRRCKSEGSLLEIESDEEFTNAQIAKQRIFDELKRIIVPEVNLIQNNNLRCPFCSPEVREDGSISYRCPMYLQTTKKQRELVPHIIRSQPSFGPLNLKYEKLTSQALAIENVNKSTTNVQDISNTLQKLYKARDLLDPVINEIILSASRLTIREIQEFRKDNYPICYITAKQFKDTSDVINMFLKVVEELPGKRCSLPAYTTSNSLSYFNEVIVNTLYLVNKDDPYGSPEEQKVYVDKFVLKELIQLHEVLGCTIAVIQDAEKKGRHKPNEFSPKDSDSIEITRKLSAASKASLSHKRKVHKESKSKKFRSSKVCAPIFKDQECKGVSVKPPKRPSHAMTEVESYKECSKASKTKCKVSDEFKECQKKGLFSCCKKKCKKPKENSTKGRQDENKRKSISFADSKDNVQMDIKIDGRPIQIRMDKNTKEYLVRSLQKSKPLSITASDDRSPNGQESSNFINSVILDRQNHYKRGSPYPTDCNCGFIVKPEQRSIGETSQDVINNSSENFDASPLKKIENTYTQTEGLKTCKAKNAFTTQDGPCPFICLNYTKNTRTLNLMKGRESQSRGSDSESLISKCLSGDIHLYPNCDEGYIGNQNFIASGKNGIWDSDLDSKLSNQSVSLSSLQKCSYQQKSLLNTSDIKGCQKEALQFKYNIGNDSYRKAHKTSQVTETHFIDYMTRICIAEKDIELSKSLESCSDPHLEVSSCGSLTRKYTLIHNQTKPCRRPTNGTSETSFKVYTALNATGMVEQSSINQPNALNVCCKCYRALQSEDEKGQDTKYDEEGSYSVAIQASQHSLKELVVRSLQTEDQPNTVLKDTSLQHRSEQSLSSQNSNSPQTSRNLRKSDLRLPAICRDSTQGTSNSILRGCLKSQQIRTSNSPSNYFHKTDKSIGSMQEPALKEPNKRLKSLPNDLQEKEGYGSCDKSKQCCSGEAQSSFLNTSSFPERSNADLKEKKYIMCSKHCRGRATQSSYMDSSTFIEMPESIQTEERVLCPDEGKETQTLTEMYNSELEKERSVNYSATQTNDENQPSLYREEYGVNQESEDKDKSTAEKKCLFPRRILTICSSTSTSTECKCNRDTAEIQTNQSSDNDKSDTQEESQSNKDADASSLQIQTGEESSNVVKSSANGAPTAGTSGTGNKDLMTIKIVVPEAAAAAIEQRLKDETTSSDEYKLPVSVEIVSSFSTNVKVFRSAADIDTNSKRLSMEYGGKIEKTSLSRHITPVNNLLPPRHKKANRVKVPRTFSRPGVRVNSDSICRCNQLPQRYDRVSDSNRRKNNFQGDFDDCECKYCSCPSLVAFDGPKENVVQPSSRITNDQKGSSVRNIGTWRQTVLEAIYRLLFGNNCENFKKGQECEIDVEDTTTTIKYSQECQCPSIHTFRNRNKKESVTYRCNLVSSNFGDLSIMRKAIDRDLISKLGDILKVKSSKMSSKGNKLDLSLILSFQTQTIATIKTKESISCTTEPENSLKIVNTPWGITTNFKLEKCSFKKNRFSGQTSTSFLKNILKKQSCHSILINPLVENSLQNELKWTICRREPSLDPFSEKPKGYIFN